MAKKIKIYVANLSEYNSGNMLGFWFTLPESFKTISKALKLGQDGFGEEWIILDYEAPFKISEYESIDRLNDIAEKLDSLPDFIVMHLDNALSYEDLDSILENGGENFRVYKEVSNQTDLGYAVVDEVYGDINDIPENILRRHFDYKGFGREQELASKGFYGKGVYIEYIE